MRLDVLQTPESVRAVEHVSDAALYSKRRAIEAYAVFTWWGCPAVWALVAE